MLEEQLEKKAVIDFQPPHQADLPETRADIGKAKRLLNWEPEIGLAEGIEKTIAWYKQNRHWLRDLEM